MLRKRKTAPLGEPSLMTSDALKSSGLTTKPTGRDAGSPFSPRGPGTIEALPGTPLAPASPLSPRGAHALLNDFEFSGLGAGFGEGGFKLGDFDT